jgi:hypothetical protein
MIVPQLTGGTDIYKKKIKHLYMIQRIRYIGLCIEKIHS